jgi:hypothetical protein
MEINLIVPSPPPEEFNAGWRVSLKFLKKIKKELRENPKSLYCPILSDEEIEDILIILSEIRDD